MGQLNKNTKLPNLIIVIHVGNKAAHRWLVNNFPEFFSFLWLTAVGSSVLVGLMSEMSDKLHADIKQQQTVKPIDTPRTAAVAVRAGELYPGARAVPLKDAQRMEIELKAGHAELAEALKESQRELAETKAELELLHDRERKCPTMDYSEKVALVRALQEIAISAGLSPTEASPAQIVKAVYAQSKQLAELRRDWRDVESHPLGGEIDNDGGFTLFAGYEDTKIFAIKLANGDWHCVVGHIGEGGEVCYQNTGDDIGWSWDDVSYWAPFNFPKDAAMQPTPAGSGEKGGAGE